MSQVKNLLILACVTFSVSVGQTVANETLEKAPKKQQEVKLAKKLTQNIFDLVQTVSDRIVSIEVDREPEQGRRRNRRPIRGLSPGDQEGLQDYYRRPKGAVTGLLLDHKGHILTSDYNVLGTIKKIKVTLSNGESYEAKVHANSPADDIALLKTKKTIDKKLKLSPIKWGNPKVFRSGLFTLAIGSSPEPGQATATVGIVSAPKRNAGRAFQTDAAMNYGNVGGPLIDLQGNIVGLSAFVGHTYPHWGFNSGIGFGVRADLIQKILPELKKGKSFQGIERPLLGVAAENRHRGPGAKINLVSPGSGADKAGMKPQDTILIFNGAEVIDFPHLRHLIFKLKPGAKVKLKVKREDKELDLEVTLGKFDPRV